MAPGWLLAAYSQMQQPKNFVAGKQQFYALCQKTPEHAARTLKQFYGVTPTELVNSLRLTYAAELLRQRGYRVLDVCFECGLENPPWFYKAFVKKLAAPRPPLRLVRQSCHRTFKHRLRLFKKALKPAKAEYLCGF